MADVQAPEKKEISEKEKAMQKIQIEYNADCARLGDLVFRKSLAETDVDRLEYEASKLRNKLQSLNKAMAKLVRNEPDEEVSKPVEEVKPVTTEGPNEQAPEPDTAA